MIVDTRYNMSYLLLHFMLSGCSVALYTEGKQGKVIDIRGWDSESWRSVANVQWTSGSTNVYRLGHKGKVDLKYVKPGAGWNYYPDHLMVLGQCWRDPAAAASGSQSL